VLQLKLTKKGQGGIRTSIVHKQKVSRFFRPEEIGKQIETKTALFIEARHDHAAPISFQMSCLVPRFNENCESTSSRLRSLGFNYPCRGREALA
jgi:hypothetical protein